MGAGRNPGVEYRIKLGLEAKIAEPRITEIIDQTRSAIGAWPKLAKQYGVDDANARVITRKICPDV